MNRFYDLKIGTKLQSGFILVAAIAGIIGWVGLSKVSQLRTSGATLYAARLVPIQDLAYVNFGFLNARTDLRALLLPKLVSALGFFGTGDTGHAGALRTKPAPSLAKLQDAVAQRAGVGAKKAFKSGVALKLRDNGDHVDKEFERC